MHTNRTFRCAFLLIAPAIFIGAPHASAKPDKKAETAQIKIKSPVKAGDITKPNIEKPKQIVVGEQFNLWFCVSASDCNDPIFPGDAASDDHAFEAYGELKINGQSQWKSERQFAHQFRIRHLDLPKPLEVDPRKQGFSLNESPTVFMDEHPIVFNTDTQSIAHITLKLTDKDDPDSDDVRVNNPRRNQADKKDDLIGDYKIDLNLDKLGAHDGHYYWFWSGTDEGGNKVGTNLYLFVQHVKTIYGTESRRPPVIEPKIIDKKLPGKPVGPGPVAAPSAIKKTAPAQTR